MESSFNGDRFAGLRILYVEDDLLCLDEELEKAREIHGRSLPVSLPEVKGLSLASCYQPAQKLGGDFYEVVQKGKKLVLYLSDVAGHGLDGALLSMFIKHTLQGYFFFVAEKELRAGEIVSYRARRFCRENYPYEYFICIFLVVLDLETLELTYCGAGFQDPPLVQLGDGTRTELCNGGHLITSPLPEELLHYGEKSIFLTPGSTLLFATDGLTEQGGPASCYRERLAHVFYAHAHLPPALIVRAIAGDFRSFNGGSLQGKDDITLLVLQMERGETGPKS